MWFLLAVISSVFLGIYDVAKKKSVETNAVLPVLLLNAIISTFLFFPIIISTEYSLGWFDNTFFHSVQGDFSDHIYVMIKALIVTSSWIGGYFAVKHLPLTLVGPINASRPILVLLGAILLYSERPNLLQWSGIILSIISIFLLSRTSKKEGISFRKNKWIWVLFLAVLCGGGSGLYDKYIMRFLNPIFVQSWFNVYNLVIMSILVGLLWLPQRKTTTRFEWRWSIPFVSIFISIADVAYCSALRDPDAMISIISMTRRASVLISFLCGVLLFRERNIKNKLFDLFLILVGMLLIYLGTNV